jgi:hypothetical protein
MAITALGRRETLKATFSAGHERLLDRACGGVSLYFRALWACPFSRKKKPEYGSAEDSGFPTIFRESSHAFQLSTTS